MNKTLYQYCQIGLKQIAKYYSIDFIPDEASTINNFNAPAILGLSTWWDTVNNASLSPLVSIFSYLDNPEQKQHFSPQQLNLSQHFFSYQAKENPVPNIQKDFDTINTLTSKEEQFNQMALQILERYGSSLAIHETLSHISVLDAIKLSAAVEVALQEHKETVLLVAGGLSGIQDYIYTIISKTASKSLKGRSFYLQLLVDAIIKHILKSLGLSDFQVVYASGGGFLLLLGDSLANRTKIDEIHETINKSLFETHQQSLFLTLAKESIEPQSLMDDLDFPYILRQLFDRQENQKRQKWQTLIASNPSNFFKKQGKAGLWKRDAVTMKELSEKEDGTPNGFSISDYDKTSNEPPFLVNKTTSQQIELGKRLTKLQQIAVHENDVLNKGFSIKFPFTDISYKILKKALKPENLDKVEEVISFNQTKKALSPKQNIRFYGGNEIPYVSQKDLPYPLPMSFNEMAGTGDFKRLGVLRMDVDNLGTAFREKAADIFVLSSLSRSMDYFFKGYLNSIWKEKNKEESQQLDYAHRSIIIYSGGDDLFLVGQWDAMIELAEEIRESFKIWTCNNNDFTISGGISIVPHKYPIMRAATLAAKAEKEAKEHRFQSASKNSLNFLGHNFNWDNEFPILKKLKKEVEAYIEVTNNHSLFSKIAQLQELKDQAGQQEAKWTWMVSYYMYRLSLRLPQDKKRELGKKIKAWSLAISTNKWQQEQLYDLDFLELFSIACRWVELSYRTKNNKDE